MHRKAGCLYLDLLHGSVRILIRQSRAPAHLSELTAQRSDPDQPTLWEPGCSKKGNFPTPSLTYLRAPTLDGRMNPISVRNNDFDG